MCCRGRRAPISSGIASSLRSPPAATRRWGGRSRSICPRPRPSSRRAPRSPRPKRPTARGSTASRSPSPRSPRAAPTCARPTPASRTVGCWVRRSCSPSPRCSAPAARCGASCTRAARPCRRCSRAPPPIRPSTSSKTPSASRSTRPAPSPTTRARELRELRTEHGASRARMISRIEELMRRYAHVLRDSFWTEREGRYVLPVRNDAHERFPGIVHASSELGGDAVRRAAGADPARQPAQGARGRRAPRGGAHLREPHRARGRAPPERRRRDRGRGGGRSARGLGPLRARSTAEFPREAGPRRRLGGRRVLRRSPRPPAPLARPRPPRGARPPPSCRATSAWPRARR